MEILLSDTALKGKLTDEQEKYLKSLFGFFAELELPIPRQWQLEFISQVFCNIILNQQQNRINPIDQYMLCGAYGVGKTTATIFAILMLLKWANLTYPYSKVKGVVISGSEAQLYSVFWSELIHTIETTKAKNFFNYSQNYCKVKDSPYITFEPRVSNIGNLHSLAGVHAEITIVVLEEATAICDGVKEKIDSFFAFFSPKDMGFLFVTGNPTARRGFFYDIMEGESRDWNRYRIGRADIAPNNILDNDQYTQRVIKLHGIDSDDYRIGVLGHFGLDETDAFIPEYVIHSALNRPCTYQKDIYYMGVDVATGGAADYSTIVLRTNHYIVDIYRKKLSITEFTNDVFSWIRNYNPNIVAVDEMACGAGLWEELNNTYNRNGSTIKIIGVKGGMRAINRERFANKRTEVAWDMRDWLQYYGHIPPNIAHKDILLTELRSLRGAPEERSGLYCLESKTKLDKSPDVCDALSYSFAAGKVFAESLYTSRHRMLQERMRQPQRLM